MPELPEVEIVMRGLRPRIVGRTIASIARVDAPAGPKYAGLADAGGRRVDAVTRRGKFILLTLSGERTAVIHLGMTGTLSFEPPEDHVRVSLTLADGAVDRVVYFRDPRRFGRFVVVPSGDYTSLPTLAAMGPEPFDAAFTPASLAASCASRTTGIKALLLGQRVVAGLGNIYADEALWQAQIHPEAPAGAIPKAAFRQLHAAIVEILTRAIEARGTTLRDYRNVEGGSGGFGKLLQVYGHKGGFCPRCEGAFTSATVAQRTSTWCPRCQRLPKRR